MTNEMKSYKNTNEKFGSDVEFLAESKESAAKSMAAAFEEWAREEYTEYFDVMKWEQNPLSEEEYIKQSVEKMRDEFMAGLSEKR